MTDRRTFLRGAGACLAAGLGALPSAFAASPWPERTVRIIVPHAPGTSPDAMTRLVAQRLTGRLHQTFLVENRAGAGGVLGMAVAAKAPADGYTLVIGHVGSLTINPSVYAHLNYDPERDFTPITQAVRTPLLLVAAESSPWNRVADVIAAARSGERITFSSAGNGTASHMAGECFRTLAGINMTHVPFRNATDALVGVANGDVRLTFGGQPAAWPLVHGHRLRALALTSARPLPEFPDVPVVAETVKGFEILDWCGFMAPAGTPADIVARLQQEIAAILREPEVVARLRAQGLIPEPGTSEQFAQFIASERAKWSRVATQVHLRLD
jgi:tripartite-type tricarboxylate transporter receptor subunit TctC